MSVWVTLLSFSVSMTGGLFGWWGVWLGVYESLWWGVCSEDTHNRPTALSHKAL